MNFVKDMGQRPECKTLDRINGDLGYSPDNCRWATPKQQVDNRYIKPKRKYFGVRYHKGKYNASVSFRGKSCHLLCHDSEDICAVAVDYSRKLLGVGTINNLKCFTSYRQFFDLGINKKVQDVIYNMKNRFELYL